MEMCNNNQYGTVCSNSWDINEAIIVCNTLGYFGKPVDNFIYIVHKTYSLLLTGTSTAYSNAYFGQGTGQILLSDLGCTGTEISLLSCPFSNNGSTSCTHSQDAGVICSTG